MPKTLRLAGIIRESTVDGPGYRMTVFAQGCPHRCPGCHNPETHDFDGGYETDTDKLIKEAAKDSLLAGLTFSGGEPFCQPEGFCELADRAHEMGLDVMAYTGYTFEQIYNKKEQPGMHELLTRCDWLKDGRFVQAKKDLTLKFRGSSNQRIIDVKESLKKGYAVEVDYENF